MRIRSLPVLVIGLSSFLACGRSSETELFPLALLGLGNGPVVQTAMEGGHTVWAETLTSDFERAAALDLVEADNGSLRLTRTGSGYASAGTYRSKVHREAQPFNSVQVSWSESADANSSVEVSVRFSADGATWSAWQIVESTEEDLILTQDYAHAQYQVKLATAQAATSPGLHNISLLFDHILPPGDLVGVGKGSGGTSFRMTIGPPSPNARSLALEGGGMPSMVDRALWGARAPTQAGTAHVPNKITVHHTWVPTIAQYRGAATIAGIQNYHMDTNGWSDIGYHYLIGPDGTIFKGRDDKTIGSHAVPNTGNIGICLIGDFDAARDVLEGAQREALLQLLAYLSVKYSLPPNDPEVKRIYGHHDFSTKTCPGTTVYDNLPAIRVATAERISSTGWLKKNPLLLVNAYERGGDGSARLAAYRTALTALGHGFDEATAAQIRSGAVPLNSYVSVFWVLVNESTANATFDAGEQGILRAYLEGGGSLFVSGTEIGWDLDYSNNGRDFFRNYLKALYKSDNSGSGNISAAAGAAFAGITGISFARLAPYAYPDAITTYGGSQSALAYGDAESSTAGVTFEGRFGASGTVGRVVYLAFGLESLSDPASIRSIMERTLTFFGGGNTASSPILINEVLANAGGVDWDGSGSATTSDEWIELYNPNSAAVDLGGYRLDDVEGGGSSPYVIPAGTAIPARGVLVIHKRESGLVLNNDTDSVNLYDPTGARIDSISWNGSVKDQSLYRVSDGGAWASGPDDSPTPGQSNEASASSGEDSGSGPGGAPPSVTVVINEYLPDGAEFIELYNRGSAPVDLSGWKLDDITNGGAAPYSIPAGTTIGPGAHVVFTRSFGLNNGGDTVNLIDSTGTVVDSHSYNSSTPNVSVGRAADGSAEWTTYAAPTPGASNVVGVVPAPPAARAVVINEIMWDGSSLSSSHEFIELRNTTGSPVNLAGWTFWDDGNLVHTFTEGTIAAGGFFLIERTEAATPVPADMLLSSLSLANTGDQLMIKDPSGTTVDTANGSGAWLAGQDTAEGVSMARTLVPGDGTQPANWFDSTTLTAGRACTPRAANN